jgi:hypothetical protein
MLHDHAQIGMGRIVEWLDIAHAVRLTPKPGVNKPLLRREKAAARGNGLSPSLIPLVAEIKTGSVHRHSNAADLRR